VKITFDVESMSLGEVEQFEEISGVDITHLDGGALSVKAMIALVYISEHRQNPEYTIDDARRVKIMDLQVDTPDPTSPETADS